MGPHIIKYRNSLEAVQRKAARFVYGDYRWRASPTNMLNTLGWKNLKARRRDSRLNLMYDITHNITAVSAEELGMVAPTVERKQIITSNFEPWERFQHSSMDRLSPAPFQNGTDWQLLQPMQYLQHRSSRN